MPAQLAKVIGHRGLASLAPENTLVSFAAAKEAGLSWIEFDVKLCRNAEPIIFHDETLNRTTSKRGKVVNTKLEDILKLDAGSWFAPNFAHARIPTLENCLSFCIEQKININIEIKPNSGEDLLTAEKVMDTLESMKVTDSIDVIVSSFSFQALLYCRTRSDSITLGLLESQLDRETTLEKLAMLKAYSLHLNRRFISADLLKFFCRHSYKVLVFTVNTQAEAEKFWSIGVDSVFTDYPLKAPQ